jgi:hypothetical protein
MVLVGRATSGYRQQKYGQNQLSFQNRHVLVNGLKKRGIVGIWKPPAEN